MFLKVALLAKAFAAIFTLKIFDARVESDMVFKVARFIKGLTTSVYQTF